MAKKEKFDDLKFDDLDFDDFDEPPRQNNKTRNPILNTLNVVRKSALATIWPAGKRDQVILKGMPPAAADAYKGYATARDATRDVYAHTKDELIKTERTLKQQARQLGPTMKRYLPDAITRRVDKWAKSDLDQSGGPYDPQQAGLDRMMGEVFGGGQGMSEQDQADAQKDVTEQRLRDSVRDMKSDKLMDAVLGIARDVNLQTGLSRGVFLNVERKQLEIQYRILFSLQDMAKLKQTEFDRNTPALEAIVKNTALPDYAKEQFSEVHWASVRRKAADWMNPLKYADGFMDQLKNNATKKISSAFGEGRGLLEMLMGGAVEDNFDMDDSSSLSPDRRKQNGKDKATGWLTSFLAKKLVGPQVEKLQNKTRAHLEANPQAMRAIEKAKYHSRNFTTGTGANSAMAGEDDGFMSSMYKGANALGLINPLTREKAFLDERNVESLNKASKFDRKTWLSINEIIPAWLSEINKSIRRGYGEHADMEYDITTRGFTTRRELADRVRGHVANDKGRVRQQENINGIVNYIDPQSTLDPKERQGLSDYLESRVSLGRSMDVEQILKDSSKLHRYMNGNAADKVVGLLRAKSNAHAGGSYGVSNELYDKIANSQASVKGYQSSIDEAVGIHGERILRDAGIFNYDKKNQIFGSDRDLTDPFTMFNDTRTGKTRSGRALTREQEILRKLSNGSATADYIRRKYGNDGVDDTLSPEEALKDVATRGGKGGRNRGGITARQMAQVLYGGKETNMVELLEGVGKPAADTSATDRIVEAIRATNNVDNVASILAHIKNMDENGVLLASLIGGGGGDGADDIQGPPRPGGGRRGGPGRRRIVLGEEGLLRRWGGILFDTAGSTLRGAGRAARGAKNRLGRFGAWARGKFSGAGGGNLFGGAFNLAKNTIKGGLESVAAFGKGLLGIKDIYDEKGNVVLQGKKLERGEYYQKHNEGSEPVQLNTLDDIRLGFDIIDALGNVILTAADLADAGRLRYYKGGRVQRLFEALSSKAGGLARGVIGAPKRFLDKISPKAKSVREWFTNAPDIYVRGESTPRLLAVLMRQGKYLLKATGQPVFKVKDIVGPIVDEQGNEIITQTELENPDFKLVDRWGREVKSPLGRIAGRIFGIGKRIKDTLFKIPGMVRHAGGKLKDLATNNPIANWFKNRDGKGGDWFSGNSLFGGVNTTGKKTNHILIRIYKLLNKRMAGEPEDEAWIEEIEKGKSGSKTLDKLKNSLGRRVRGAKVGFKRRWGRRGRAAGNWLRGKGASVAGWFGRARGRGEDFMDSFRGAEHDIGTRYDVEKHLAGRDDDVADFYRSHLYKRGGYSKAKITGAVRDDLEEAKDAAGNVINSGKNKARSLGSRLLERVNKMVDLQEVSWFNTMRESLERNGAGEGFIRGMYSKFTRRVKFNASGEKRDYLQFFRRKVKDDEGATGGRRSGGGGKKGGGIMDFFKGLPLIGPLVSILSTVGSIVGTIAKWGLIKPGKLLAKGAWQIGKFAVTRAIPLIAEPLAAAGAAIVAAVGWPAILIGGAIAGVGFAAYRIATSTYTEYLDTMRLAQYGYRDYDKWSSDDGAKAKYLEATLKDYISFNEAGAATCRGLGGRDVEALAKGYEINVEDKAEMLAFQAFMLQRFIPVYLRWLTALKGMDRDIQLADVGNGNKVTKEEMTTLYEKTALAKDAVQLQALTDPRKVNQGFMSSMWDTVTFTPKALLDAEEVMDVQTDVKRAIARRIEDKKNRNFRNNAIEKRGIEEAGVQEAFTKLASLDEERNKNAPKVQGWEDGTEQVQIQIDQFGHLDQKDVDALESLRFKTYGMKDMSSSYIGQLKQLEAFVIKDIDIKRGTYKGKWNDAMDIIDPGAWKAPGRGDRLKLWFTARFLPTFMFYVCGFHRYDPAGDPLKLKLTGGYLYELGLLVVRAYNMRAGIRQSVWEVAVNPFGEDANTDSSSTSKELETLKVLSKEADLAVRNLLKETKANGKIAKWQDRDKNVNFFENSDDTKSQTYTPEEQAKMDATHGFGGKGFSGIPNDISQSADAVGGVSNWAKLSTGSAGINLGEIQDGDYKQLAEKYPRSTLNDQNRVKAMIADVAKMMGVPPAIALAMANAESGFNINAKNPYGSASGLFQFTNDTWGDMMNGFGRKYGISGNTTAMDPYANTIMGMQFIRDNIKRAQNDLGGKAPPPAVAYLYHFLGGGGGSQFLKAWQKNPNASAGTAPGITQKILNGNRGVFYTQQGKGRIRTMNEVIMELNGRMGSVVSNEIGADPKNTKSLTAGLTPASYTSSPAGDAGAAANDPSMSGTAAGAAQDLPADNENRRDGALAAKGAAAASDALAGSSAGPTLPGAGGGGSNDMASIPDNVEAQAKADGLSDADAAKVRNAAAARTAAATPVSTTATSDASTSAPTLNRAADKDPMLITTQEIRDTLVEMRDMMRNGGSLQSSGGAQPPAGGGQKPPAYTTPTPSLSVSRKAG